MQIQQTQLGTFIKGQIEYNELPPPSELVKCMSRKWALEFLNHGKLRAQSLEFFRNWKNDTLGDPHDGKGMFLLNGRPMESDSAPKIYAWCSCLPEVTDARLREIAKSNSYDCLVRVKKPEILFQRMWKWLTNNIPGFWVHCGIVQYNRGTEVSKEELNSQKFNHNVFQKGARFSEDKEYRVSFVYAALQPIDSEHIDIELGSCNDILAIEELPNK